MTLESLFPGDRDFLEHALRGLNKPLFGVDTNSIGHIENALSGLEGPVHKGKRDLLAEAHNLVEAGLAWTIFLNK